MPENDKIKTHCPECDNSVNSIILKEHRTSWDEIVIEGSDVYQIVQCQACDHYFFQKISSNSDDYYTDEETWEQIYNETKKIYPATFKKIPNWLSEIKIEGLETLFEQIYGAVANEFYTLACMGIRSVVDYFYNERLGDIGGFEQKLKALMENQLITKDEYTILELLVELGNASTHRYFHPSKDKTLIALKMIEHILERLYITTKRTEKFAQQAIEIKPQIPKNEKTKKMP